MQFIHRWSSVAYHTVILSFQVYLCICACATHRFYNSQCLHLAQPHSSLLPSHLSISYISFPNAISCKKFQAHNVTLWRILLSLKIQPYIPPTPAPLCCKCPKYCLLVVFHAAMYFSMQFVKAVCSEDEMEEPGLGIARSKQCSLTFCKFGQNVMRSGINCLLVLCDGSDRRGLLLLRGALLTSTRKRAFCRAACWRTCCMTSVFASRAILNEMWDLVRLLFFGVGS
jgi:hypothetical protein